jgi:hypothetical protein
MSGVAATPDAEFGIIPAYDATTDIGSGMSAERVRVKVCISLSTPCLSHGSFTFRAFLSTDPSYMGTPQSF